MIRRTFVFLSIVLGLLLILGTQYLQQAATQAGPLRRFLLDLLADLNSPDKQWMVAICLGVYFVLFTHCQRVLRMQISAEQAVVSKDRLFLGFRLADFLLCVLIGFASIAYFSNYSEAATSPDCLVLFGGITLGQGVGALGLWRRTQGYSCSLDQIILPPVVFVLTLASVFHPDMGKDYQYREQMRWTGPWNNPNTFGLLMGVGLILAIGLLVQLLELKYQSPGRKPDDRVQMPKMFYWLRVQFLSVAAALMGVGLVKSYSRGAWVATFCALAYLAHTWTRNYAFKQQLAVSSTKGDGAGSDQLRSKWSRFLPAITILLLSVLIIAFWSFRHTEQPLIRRIFSVGNMNDFSWRNRVIASEGALQMMGQKPWFGFGWNQPEPVYNEYFLPPKLSEGLAIVLNDYFLLGMTLGLPTLVCFVGYIWLSLTPKTADVRRLKSEREGSDIRHPISGIGGTDWLRATCRAGFIVLLIGFLPDRGLFYLALSAPFWVLLELAAET